METKRKADIDGAIRKKALEFIRFYRECVVRAFTGRFWKIEQWTGGISVVLLLVARFLPLPEGTNEVLTVDVPLYFFSICFVGTVFVGFVTAPVNIFIEEREKCAKLEDTRRPRLRIYASSQLGEEMITEASTSETYGGWRQTHISGSLRPALSLTCQNTSEVRSGQLTAKIIRAECLEGEKVGEIPIVEPIALAWAGGTSGMHLSAELDPNEARRIWIAHVRSGGQVWLARDVKELPLNYQQVFGPAGRYKVAIQISDGVSAPVTTTVELVGEPGERPKSGVHFGKGKISVIESV